MPPKESNRQRQEYELEVIQSIFGVDVEDLRTGGEWKPLEVKIALKPQQGSSGIQDAYAKTHLHVICTSKYPKIAPKITLEDSKGLSDVLLEELLQQLHKQADNLKGEVMIFELAQTVQAFLHKHNKPPSGSFYDEMLLNKYKRDQDRLQTQKAKENIERQLLMDEVLKRKEMLKSESRIRRETRRSISESSPTHRTNSSSDNSESSTPFNRNHLYPNECSEHRSSDTLYFSNVGRKIQKGSCLGHSEKGCVAYSGIDLETGQLLYITEWNIKYAQIEAKCIGNCNRGCNNEPRCNGHGVDEIITYVEKRIIDLSQLRFKNLIAYECVLCMKKKEGVVIYLVQDFVLGTSVSSISGTLGWCAEGASMVAKGVLDALIFLHNKGVSHSNVLDSTVFMDNTGTIRVTDFTLVPYLQELIGHQKSTKGDLPALGALIESLLPTPHSEMRNFIEKCKSERTLSASDLLEDPFLRPVLFAEPMKATNLQTQLSERSNGPIVPIHASITTDKSRIKTEFEYQQWLGEGAYGDVLKVRNILDNRQYAIKRIPLSARNRQLYKKMTREVELLSRLNHENVVRYYNSWIETSTAQNELDKDNLGAGDWSISHESRKHNNRVSRVVEESEESSSEDWINCLPNREISSSDGIEFVNSDGECVESDDEEEDDENDPKQNTDNGKRSTTPLVQFMYIQMEFCEKSTLRTAIDAGLYSDTERLWRLFREIAEGLLHIHQQGMIHRDLKPVNIFLDSRDQVKIGDFGLATTSFLALQSQEQNLSMSHQLEISNSLTGKVGTALYVAPELTGNASKSTYNQKVDLYSLGIILFEMSHPPFDTGMERVNILVALRNPSVTIPDYMINEPQYTQQNKVIQWLLNHDPAKRPTSEELLSSELVPPARLEANELQEMLRHALANPQSRAYKHLVSRCLAQQSDNVLELTYHFDLVPISPTVEYVKNKVVCLFRKHGAVEVVTPLLTPYSKMNYSQTNAVRLMTHSGSVVLLPHDLRVPFVRHAALNGINLLRRYSVGRVYREKKVFNFHPKQLYECAFDVITPNPGNLIVDAELLSIAYEITNELPILKQKNISFRLNHTSLLRAILLYCGVPTDKYSDLFDSLLDFLDGRISKFQFNSSVSLMMQSSKHSATILIDLLQSESPLGGTRGSLHGSQLRTLVRGRGEAAALAKGAIRELESVVTLAQGMGVTCSMYLYAGLPIGFERARSGGIVWQMLAELKQSRRSGPYSLAMGQRYDGMLNEFQKSATQRGFSVPNKEISGVGFSFSLDKIINAMGSGHNLENRSIDVVVCVSGPRPPLRDVTQILRSLWSAGIRSGVVEANNSDEAQDMARDLGAIHIILLGEGGVLRVRSWDHNRFQERHVTRPELIDYIQKILRPENSIDPSWPSQSTNTVSLNLKNITGSALTTTISNLPMFEVTFLTNEKLTNNMRRRYENQLVQQMKAYLEKFVKKERITIIAVDLTGPIIGSLTGAIDPREYSSKDVEDEVSRIIERYPKQKKYILEIIDEINDVLSDKTPSIVSIYSITDFCYRIIL